MRRYTTRFASVAAAFLLSACAYPETCAPPPTLVTPTETLRPTLVSTETPFLSSDIGFIERPSVQSLRVMSYNGYWDSIFPADDPDNSDLREYDRSASFVRILRVIQPDVLCLQEINYLRRTSDLGEFLAEVLGNDQTWRRSMCVIT
ncbi:MAG: endonuclease/exonuclease/phosphatase family protein [Anaerolineales bacterium]